MNLRALETLIAVVEAGGFQAAAERLNLTQSAVSMQIKALEAELGAPLFDRTRRPPLPTVAGRAAAARARAVLQAAENLRRVARDPDRIAGVLALGAIPTATTGFLPDALATLGRRHPDLRARVESGLSDALMGRVALGELDAALVTESGEPPAGLVLRPLFEEPLLVASRTAPADGRAATALGAAPFIRFNRATGVGRIIDRRLRAEGLAVTDAMELDSIESILMMVSRGLGVAEGPLTRRVALAVRRGAVEEPALGALYKALVEGETT